MYEYKVVEVTNVVDGDTIDIVLDLGFGIYKKERVRIAGIDAPEKKTLDKDEKILGEDALNYTEKWFSYNQGEIIVKTEKQSKYGQMLGWFYREDECFNHVVVKDGYAWEYSGGTKTERLLENYELLLKKRGYLSFSEYREART